MRSHLADVAGSPAKGAQAQPKLPQLAPTGFAAAVPKEKTKYLLTPHSAIGIIRF